MRRLGKRQLGGATLILLGRAIASVLMDMGLHAKARQFAQVAVNLCILAFGRNDPGTLSSQSDLALCAQGAGDLQGAQLILEEIVAIHKNIEGPHDRQTITAAGNLAGVLYEIGDLTQARILAEEAYASLTAVGRDRDAGLIVSIANTLVVTYTALEEFQKAKLLAEQTYEQSCNLSGPDSLQSLLIKNNLAFVLRELGNIDTALIMTREVLHDMEGSYASVGNPMIVVLRNMVALLRKTGNLAAAQELGERALQLCRDQLGRRHGLTSQVAWGLWGVLSEACHHSAPVIFNDYLLWLTQCDENILDRPQNCIRREILANDMGLINCSGGNVSRDAELALLDTDKIGQDIPNVHRLALDEQITNLGYAHLSVGNVVEAASCFERAVEMNPTNIAAVNNLASVLVTTSIDAARGLDLARHALTLSRPTDPVSVRAAVLDTLGWAHFRQGHNISESEGLLRQSLALYPHTRPEAITVIYHLMAVLKTQGKEREMKQLAKRLKALTPQTDWDKKSLIAARELCEAPKPGRT